MSTYDLYTTPVSTDTWDVPASGAARFSWEYDDGRQRLLDLYQRGKDKQWDATKRIDWDQPVDPANVMQTGEELTAIYGSRQYEKLNQAERDELSHHMSSWLFSQFLHGEQGALTVAARIIESVPDLDSKFYAATQAMDEARHVEVFSRFTTEKIGLFYPVNQDLARLLADALADSRWDMPYLGMQVLIEGLALAAFGVQRDVAANPLVKQLLAYVMQDEARHVAFGRLALRDYYAQLTSAELADREEFVVEGCYLMRDRFVAREVYERLGFDVAECVEFTEHSPVQQAFRKLLFTRIVESVPDMDSKFYAATQAMDEARHVELFSRFMREKIDLYYPINDDLARLLNDALTDSRWDFPYLGMQVLIEGLALAAFGVHRDVATNPLVKQLLAFVMQDEARHVAFGRLTLRDYYAELTSAERADREEFVVEGCYLMRSRFRQQEVWERMGFNVADCLEFTEHSPVQQLFRTLLFSRIVPCVKDIGLWGPKIQHAYADLGVLDAAKSDLDALMRDDEEIAERMDREQAAEFTARAEEVDEAIAEGAAE